MTTSTLECYHAGTMTRTQVQFTDEQLEVLRRISAAEGRSMADLVREGVELLIHSRIARRNPKELRERAMAAAGKFRSGLKDLAVNHDKYLAEDFGS